MVAAVDFDTLSEMHVALLGQQLLLWARTRCLFHLVFAQHGVASRSAEFTVEVDTFSTKIFVTFHTLVECFYSVTLIRTRRAAVVK